MNVIKFSGRAPSWSQSFALKLPPFINLPASFFGMVLGLAGLATAWREAADLWGAIPSAIGDTFRIVATLVWVILLGLYIDKWLRRRADAISEWKHPVQSNFIGLTAVSTMLIAISWHSEASKATTVLFAIAALGQLAFAVFRTGGYWKGDRAPETNTPALYLPTVAGNYVIAIGLGTIGLPGWGQLFFGAGVLSWFAIESILINRFLATPIAPAIRPTLGIQLAPAVVGAVAYLAVIPGTPGPVVQAMIGYGILQALILLRLLPFVWSGNGFVAGFWGYTFGATALATSAIRYTALGGIGPISVLAPVLLAFATVVVLGVAAGTLILLARGRLLGAPSQPQRQAKLAA